ncbi:hypothetical protein [Mycoplana dimorpha]|uniref:hypothetical protein n=1 Tax=Mycoplana dimorpha TaxID=28320 RepID=UPI0011B242AE|nr:hypothetical protein [Mycoplana dimorpha]
MADDFRETRIDRLRRIAEEAKEKGGVRLPQMTRDEMREYFFGRPTQQSEDPPQSPDPKLL